MEVPGLEDVRGPLEEALLFPPARAGGRGAEDLDVIAGQSGAEAMADLPDDLS